MCIKKNCVKVFPEGGGFVDITDPEGGPTATGMVPEGGTTEKKLPSTPPPPRLINETALTLDTNRPLDMDEPCLAGKVIIAIHSRVTLM